MDVKLWIDDLRPAPTGWVWAKSSDEAIEILDRWQHSSVTLTMASFDHDLGGDDTSLPVIDWFIEHQRWPNAVYVHTANPVGRRNILTSVDRNAPPEVDIIQVWQNDDGSMPDM